MASEDDAIFEHIDAWRSAGHGAALATVVRTWGSAPRRAGSHLAIEAGGGFVGSVSGGCVEAEVVRQGREVCATGIPRLLDFTVTDSEAWQVGLACGGQVRIYVEPAGRDATYPALLAARAARRAVVLITRLQDGVRALVDGPDVSGPLEPPAPALQEARARLARNESGVLAGEPELFARCYVPAPRLFIIGAVHIAQALHTIARAVGFEVTVIAFYVGALGSRRTHAQRLERLAALGLAEAAQRVRAPIGLDLGGRSAGEIAVSIVAEIIQMRCRAT